MNTIVFEDEFVSRLEPITLSRPAYAITCAGYRLCDLVEKFFKTSERFGCVRPHLAATQNHDFGQFNQDASNYDASKPTLLISARMAPVVSSFRAITQQLETDQFRIVQGDTLIAAKLPPQTLSDPLDVVGRLSDLTANLPNVDSDTFTKSIPVFEYAHDVVRFHMEYMNENLEHRMQVSDYREVREGVFASGEVTIGEHLVTDTSAGPIVIESGARIGSHCFLQGPILIGKNATVNEHASIKDAVVLGHTSKVGGEVEATVIEPFSNKQHYGFLGHAYVGSWVNLGAGTSNSDLKNTYGKIRVKYPAANGEQNVETGMQFLGCIIGDYTKSAINTSIFTGKLIGCCSMLYGFVTSNVPSFVNFAKSFGQVSEMPADVMIETQRRTYGRRNIEHRECDRQLIRDMFEMTQRQRPGMSGQPLAL